MAESSLLPTTNYVYKGSMGSKSFFPFSQSVHNWLDENSKPLDDLLENNQEGIRKYYQTLANSEGETLDNVVEHTLGHRKYNLSFSHVKPQDLLTSLAKDIDLLKYNSIKKRIDFPDSLMENNQDRVIGTQQLVKNLRSYNLLTKIQSGLNSLLSSSAHLMKDLIPELEKLPDNVKELLGNCIEGSNLLDNSLNSFNELLEKLNVNKDLV